jgi:tetratricopeptide (TPR) repeat protein
MFHNIMDHSENGLVIFCGAGVSMVAPTCLPSWWQMNEQVVLALSRQIAPFCGEERAADLAQQINSRRDNQRFPPEFQAEIISNHYGATYFKVLECLDGNEPNAVHLAIAKLAMSGHIRAIVTSNFDRLIEVAFRKLDVPLDVHYQASHFEKLANEFEESSLRQSRCQLLKLHGSVDDHYTLVDTLAQRMRGFSPAICSCLRHLLRNHYWLFMGYSGGDLEANSQYLCLQPEANHTRGFTWLVRETAKNEPIEAVVKICNLYGDRAIAPRGELPAWFFEQFGSLLTEDSPPPSLWSKEELDRRKQDATQSIIDHTREWSNTVGGVRAALVLADMLEQSVNNPQASRELLTLVLNTQEQDHSAYAAVANSLANMLIKTGELDEAMELAEKALAKTSLDNLQDRAGILGTMGLIEHKRGEYRRALNLFEQLYETSAQLKDDNRKSIALHNRAMALTSLGQYDQAKSCYEEGLKIAQKLGDVIAQAQTLNNIGDLLRQLDRYDDAIEVLNQAIKLRERLGDDRGVANCLGNIASAYTRQGKFAEAKSIYEQILAIFQRIGDKPSEVTTIFNLGRIAQDLSDFAETERLYRQAITIATECGLEPERAGGLWKLASLYRVTSRNADVQRLYDEALAIYQKNGDRAGEAAVLNEIGILLWQTGQLELAMSTFKQAIAIREQLNQQAGRCEAISNLALVFMDKDELDQAMELLKEKLSIAEGIQSKSLIASAHYNIGVLQHKQGEKVKALNSFEVAQRLYQEMGQTNQTIDILSTMGEICGRERQIGISLKWFDQAIQLAAGGDQRTKIAERLMNILELLLQHGYDEPAQKYVQRLRSIEYTNCFTNWTLPLLVFRWCSG